MPILAILVSLELLVSVVLINTSPTSPLATNIRHMVGQVLSEETIVPPEPTPTDTPTQTPTETPLPTETPTPIPETPTPTSQQETPTKTPTETPTVTQEAITTSPTEKPSPSPTPEVSENQNIQAVVNSNDIISTPHEVDQSTIENAQHEDTIIETAQTPAREVELLTDAVAQKAIDMDFTIKEDDFSTTSFLTQRLTAQIEQATDTLKEVTPRVQQQLKQSLIVTCNKTDTLLKTEQLSVPEDLEPDIEIARGLCLTLQP